MQRSRLLVWAVIVLCLALPVAARQDARGAQAPILVQGAMASETDRLVAHIDNARAEQIGGWRFWVGTVDGYPVVVSRTNKGMSNAAAATAIAVERFHPRAIVNQGTAGGHDPALHVYDIVLGTRALNVGAFRAMFRERGDGSRPLEWVPLDLTADGSAINPNAPHTPASFEADAALLALAKQASSGYTRGRVVDGVIGSSDMWIDELDRVALLHDVFGTSVEEMETASAAQVASGYRIPFIGVRVLSDNITNHSTYDSKTGEACQDFVHSVVQSYIRTLR
jgi:adenosylhomocysteine nucleosidase